MQTLLRDSAAGLMHSLIYFPFLILFAVTTVLEIDHQMPPSLKFLHGTTYQAYKLVGDTAGVLFLIGVTWAIVRRYVVRPYRIRIKTRPEDAVILGTLFVIGVTGLLVQAFRIAMVGRPSFEKWAFVGYPLSAGPQHFGHLAVWHRALWVTHVGAFFLFVMILPITKMRHMFTSPINMYPSDRDRPKGAMKPLPNLTETSLETFGANAIEDFTWKQLLDTDACTMCGRCTSVCPAHATGKPLDPREIVLKVGQVMSATGSPPVSPSAGAGPRVAGHRQQCFRPHYPRGDLGLHDVQGLRRDLPGEHRDPRQDPRHAPLPLADGVELPDRAGQGLPGDGKPVEPLGPAQQRRARRLGQGPAGGGAHRRPVRPCSSMSTSSG